jgi:hypothetical protein
VVGLSAADLDKAAVRAPAIQGIRRDHREHLPIDLRLTPDGWCYGVDGAEIPRYDPRLAA